MSTAEKLEVNIVDADARALAVDVSRSFCVSAPAGSGKTELLIQRFLALLSRVERPEQVLAITFTRKAAAEMRERVLQALQAARAGEPCTGAHEQKTRTLAELALDADAREQWQLVRDISRMNIKTIDSFCGGLTRQMPILSGFGGQATVLDDATELYAQAGLELFGLLDTKHPVAADLASLMLHFDNNWERLQKLLVAMLARRDQWQSYMGVHHVPNESEAYLLRTVKRLVTDSLSVLATALMPYSAELLSLLQFSAANLGQTPPSEMPGTDPGEVPRWRVLRNLLLTRDGGWRKRLDKTIGFPPGKGENQERKAQLQAIIARLGDIDGLGAALAAVNMLPEISAGDPSWRLVLSLSHVLPILEAQLLLVFARQGAVDHCQVALSALQALGEDDAPTELALRLDYQIEHILVDEFQDTAINQYELLRRLTRGWGQYNAANLRRPRTVMIVGDGMQSIYGFRNANVSLFLQARQEGFNGVALEPVTLLSNFRSDEGIVDWVNQTFAWAFPREDDIGSGQVSFTPATAVRPELARPAVSLHAFQGEQAREQEVAFICDQIALACQDSDCASVAVLGRSRSHLQPVIAGLRERDIAYAAQDVDALASSPLVTDLLTLCRVLVNRADRLAWMALLRAPWCALELADLLELARWGDEGADTPVFSALQEPGLQDRLSSTGARQLAWILPPLQRAFSARDRLALRVWVEQLWLDLGGAATAGDAGRLEDAESFFGLLERAEQEGVGLDLQWLEQQLQKHYVSANDPAGKVQLMTLHKAKGLEFDRVIIPQLDRITRAESRPLLLWDELYIADGQRSFLLAADDHSASGEPTLYNYLQVRRQEKALLETTRLLYVGATRAIGQLVLTASLKQDEKNASFREPARRSLLSPIWPTFAQQMTIHEPLAASTETRAPTEPAHALIRLRRDEPPQPRAPSPIDPEPIDANIPARPDNFRERCVGTVIHLALEEISKREALPRNISDNDRRYWRAALARLGLWGANLENALEAVVESVTTTLAPGGTGCWILSGQHLQARSEWALTAVDPQGEIEELVIDRSFVDRESGTRWLIDYKSSRPAPGQPLSTFLDQEAHNYREQLLRYRRVLRELFPEALCCALYFTALGELHHLPELDLKSAE